MSTAIKKGITLGLLILSGLYLSNVILESFVNLDVSDFSTYYHIPAHVFQSNGRHPYTNYAPFHPYYYPPPSLILFLPLSFFDFFLAKVLFSILSLLAFLGSFILLLKIVGKKLSDLEVSFLFFLAALFYPVRFSLEDGQINLILLFLICSAFYAYKKYRDYLAGALLGLATIFKISPFLLAFYFVFRRRSKILLSAICLFIIFSIAAEFILGSNLNWFYWRYIVDDVAKQGGPVYRDQSLTSFLLRLKFIETFWQNYLSSHFEGSLLNFERFVGLLNYAFVGLLSLLIVWSGKKRPSPSDPGILLDYLLLSILAVVGSGLAWFHQYALFVFPILVAFVFAFKVKEAGKKLILLGILSVSYLSMAVSLENQFHISGQLQGLTSAVMFYGVGLLSLILLYFRYKVVNL